MEKDLNYWKKNAEEDYMKVPISVLRYITELENSLYTKEDMKEAYQEGKSYVADTPPYFDNFEQFIQSLKK